MPPLWVDIDAFCCYGVILALGALTAVIATLSPFPGELRREAWMVPASWAVFLGYLAAPLLVFWLLDATGVSNDTSLVAAVIVAVTSHQMLSGSDPKLQLPEGVTGWWRQFLQFSAATTRQVTERSARNRRRFLEKLVQHIRTTPRALDGLTQFVRATAPEALAVDLQLQKIDASAQGANPPLSAAIVQEQKARWLLQAAAVQDDSERRLKDRDIIPVWLYVWYLRGWRSVFFTVVAFVLGVGLVAGGMRAVLPEDWRIAYSVARLAKATASDLDVHRARRRIEGAIAQAGRVPEVRERLVGTLRRPGLPVARAELMLALLMQTEASDHAELAFALVQALRSPSTDVRARVNNTLSSLLGHAGQKAAAPAWDPLKQISPVEVEDAIEAWRAIWKKIGAAPAGQGATPPP